MSAQDDVAAVQAIYDGLGLAQPDAAPDIDTICDEWVPVYCTTTAPRRVQQLHFYSQGLSGTIAAEVGARSEILNFIGLLAR